LVTTIKTTAQSVWVQTLIQTIKASEAAISLIKMASYREGKRTGGELAASLEHEEQPARLFIGTNPGRLGYALAIERKCGTFGIDAPRAFTIYRRGLRSNMKIYPHRIGELS